MRIPYDLIGLQVVLLQAFKAAAEASSVCFVLAAGSLLDEDLIALSNFDLLFFEGHLNVHLGLRCLLEELALALTVVVVVHVVAQGTL